MQTTTTTGVEWQPQVQSGGDDDQRKKKMRVMVAIDESDWSFYAPKWALDHLFVGPTDQVAVALNSGTAMVEAVSQENVSMMTLVHVMQQHYVLPAGPCGAALYAPPSLLESERKAQEEGAASVLSRAVEICKDKMIKAESLILRGDPKDMICQVTEQMHVDLLVVGSCGLGMVKRPTLAPSLTTGVERHPQVQSGGDDDQRKKKMRVMVAIDGSDCSFYALKWALDHLFVGPTDQVAVALNTGTAMVEAVSQENVSIMTLVHVMKPHYVLPAGPCGAALYATPSLLESERKAQQEGAASVLCRALEICKDKMIKAESLILRGDPKDMICQVTEQMHVDLLAVGSRGLGMVKRAMLGSVSDYCPHHITCPVLIVKPPKESPGK